MQLITEVKTNVSTTGSDNALVTEQGIREALTTLEESLQESLQFGVVPLEGGSVTMPWGGTVKFDVARLNKFSARFTVRNDSSIKINVTGCGYTEMQEDYEKSDGYGVDIVPTTINSGASKNFDVSISNVVNQVGASAVQSSGLLIVKRG